MIDVGQVRADTPGCAHVVHFNNAGASLPPQPVLDTVVAHLELEARVGGYEAALLVADAAEHLYDTAAALLNAGRDEIAFVDSATRAWDLAFLSVPLSEGDRVLTARAEYASNVLALLHSARRTGAIIEVVPDDEHGQVSVDALRAMLDERVKLVAITHVPTQSGLINPAAAIGAAVRDSNALFLLDACQSAGQLALDVEAIRCDFMSITGRKFLRAPRGTGLLYARRSVLPRVTPPTIDLFSATWTGDRTYELRDDARRFEIWERGLAGALGMAVAIDYARALGLEAIEARVAELAAVLRNQLRAIPGVIVHDRGARLCGIVTFTVEGIDTGRLVADLRSIGINVWQSDVTYARWDLEPRHLDHLVRASVHYYNTQEEIDRLCESVVAAAT